MGDANTGLEQIRRREAVVKLEEEVAQAVSYEQLQQAAQSIQQAMAAMPTEASLYRLNTQVERQVKNMRIAFWWTRLSRPAATFVLARRWSWFARRGCGCPARSGC